MGTHPDHRHRGLGTLTMEEVVLVLRTVELTTELIETVRNRLRDEGISLDESIPSVDEPPPAHALRAALGSRPRSAW